MNRCNTCQTLLKDNQLLSYRVHDPYATGDSPDEVVFTCPECGSDDIELDLILCDICGENEPLEGYEECLQCINDGKAPHGTSYDLCECPYCGEIELDAEAGECNACHLIVNFVRSA